MNARCLEEVLALLPEAAAEKFREMADGWEEPVFHDGRWATIGQEEDGTWIVHVNENPGGYYVGEWRLPPGGEWQDIEEGEYDWDAQQHRIDATPPQRTPHQEFIRGQTVYMMDCVAWNKEREGEVTEGVVLKYCGGEYVQYYNVSHPKWGQVGTQRWKGGDYPTNVFGSRAEAEELYKKVLERRNR